MRQLAQLGVAQLGVVERLADERLGLSISALERSLSELQRHDGMHQPLLRSVVQVADHPPSLLVGRFHDPRA